MRFLLLPTPTHSHLSPKRGCHNTSRLEVDRVKDERAELNLTSRVIFVVTGSFLLIEFAICVGLKSRVLLKAAKNFSKLVVETWHHFKYIPNEVRRIKPSFKELFLLVYPFLSECDDRMFMLSLKLTHMTPQNHYASCQQQYDSIRLGTQDVTQLVGYPLD